MYKRQGKEDAIKSMVNVKLDENNSITHDVTGKYTGASVLLKKSPEGTAVSYTHLGVCIMANVQYYDVILKPVVTEKSMNAMAEKKYTFLVHPDANKTMIKEAVERMFEGTKVAKVNTMNCEGKNRRRGMVTGKTAKTKKAIVQLTEDSKDIEIFAGL